MAEHLQDPLDYLYEELPPERMAEARRHLAVCPACRADMRAVRETVKLYRRAAKPVAPAGLAARAAKAALDQARRDGGNAATPGDQAALAAAPAALRQPAPEPAAPPAAPFAPRGPGFAPAAPVPPADPGRPGGDIDIEGEFARLKEEVLREIPKGWRTWLFHPAWTVAASVMFVCALLIHFSPRERQMETRFLPSVPLRDDSSSQRIRGRERLPASQPRAEPDGVASSGPAPILQEAAAMNEIVELPPFVPGGSTAGAGRAAAAPAPASRTIRLSRAVPPVPPAQAEPVAAPADAIMADASAPAGLAGDAAPEAPAPAAAPSPAEPIPPEMLESLSAKTAEAAEAAPVVIMNLPEADEAPQLIARPRGYDVAERVQSLTTLAGMQMAEGEFGDAGKTIALLETYDAAAAGALARTLGHLERAAREKAEAERLEKEAAAEKARLEREREKAAREQEETARREREREEAARREKEREDAAREQEAAAREKEQAAREREAEEPISVPPAFAAPAVPAVPPVDPDPLPAPAPAAVEGTAAAGSASLPAYARYLETVEPPEDPPLTAVMVPRASMAYGYAGDALSSAPPQVDPVAPYHVVRAPATPVFSPLVFPEAGEPDAAEPLAVAGESVPVAAAEIPEGDVFVEAAAEGAAASVADVAQEAVVEGEGARPEASARRAPRESVIVGVPVGAGGMAGAGESVVLVAPPVAVYVPVVPAAPPSPARVYAAPSRTETRRNRPFTTDPYFRDY